MERPWSTVAGLNWARRDRIPSPGPGQGKQLCAGIAGSVYSVGHGEAKTEIRAQIWTDGVKTLKRDVLTKRGIASCAIAIRHFHDSRTGSYHCRNANACAERSRVILWFHLRQVQNIPRSPLLDCFSAHRSSKG